MRLAVTTSQLLAWVTSQMENCKISITTAAATGGRLRANKRPEHMWLSTYATIKIQPYKPERKHSYIPRRDLIR